jgi:hypothetical protein
MINSDVYTAERNADIELLAPLPLGLDNLSLVTNEKVVNEKRKRIP